MAPGACWRGGPLAGFASAEYWVNVRQGDVILFDAVSEKWTRIRSFGVGYGDSPEYEDLMQFFIAGNEALFANLKAYLEKGEAQSWGK